MSTSDPKLAALEKSLAALVPAPGRIDRDQLLFRAGQASVRRRTWLWPSATAFMAVLAVGLGAALAVRPALSIRERIVYVSVSESRPPVSDLTTVVSPSTVSRAQDVNMEIVGEAWIGSEGYLHDRNQVIRWGVDALPPSPSVASASEAPSLESMLGLPEKKAEHSNLFPLKF